MSENYEFCTSELIIDELEDKKTVKNLENILVDIQTYQPSEKALKAIKNFSKKTGDFLSLSKQDIHLMAIAYTFADNNKALEHLNKEPKDVSEFFNKKKETKKEKEEKIEKIEEIKENFENNNDENKINCENPVNNNDENKMIPEKEETTKENNTNDKENDNVIEKNESDEKKELENKELENKKSKKENDSDSDDNEGWINSSNINQYFGTTEKKETENKIGVAVMTTDYAMQNVLLQMGFPIVSFDGLLIKQTKRFILECYACKKVCKEVSKEFCPHCGNHTLTKISCSFKNDGSIVLYRKKNFKINTRGNIYSIPKSTGGRKNNDLLLREDEFFMGNREYLKKNEAKQLERKFKSAMIDFENGFGFEKIKSKENSKKLEYGYGKTNPNDRMQMKSKKKKK